MSSTEVQATPAEGRDGAPEAGSLFRRYLLWIGASVFLFMGINGVAQSILVWRDTEAALRERHSKSVNDVARRVSSTLNAALGDLRFALKLMEGYAGLDVPLLRQELHRLLKAQGAIQAAQVESTDGIPIVSAARMGPDVSLGNASAQSGRAMLAAVPSVSDQVRYSEVYLHRGSEPRINVALLGTARRVLRAELSLTFLNGVLAEAATDGAVRLYIIDRTERVIAHSDSSRALSALAWSHLHREAPPPAGATLVNLGDVRSGGALVSTASIAALDALVVLEQARDVAWRPVRDSVMRSAFATAVAMLLAAAAALLLVRRMERPLAALARANERVRIQGEQMRVLNAELGRRNDQLSVRSAEAERANIAKTRFIAAASHDLRQPLHTVALLSHLVGRRLQGADDVVLGQQLLQATAAMDHLFQGILDISKLDLISDQPQLPE